MRQSWNDAVSLIVAEPIAETEPSGDDPAADFSTHLHRTEGLLALLVVAVVATRYWAPMLSRGFRFDENLTGWVVSGTFMESIQRSWEFQGQSPLYFALMWCWQAIVGTSDLSLRLPSMLALGATAWNLVRLGETLDTRRAGIIAAVLLCGMQSGATEARPYVFLLLALTVGARCGLRWFETDRMVFGVAWVVAAACAIYMHPFAVYALAAQLSIAYCHLRGRGKVVELVKLAVLAVALVAPIVPQVLRLRSRQDSLVIAEMPGLGDLASALVPGALLVAVAVGAIVGRQMFARRPKLSVAMWLVIGWAVAPALGLFVQSHLTGSSVFVERYFMTSSPAIALLGAMLITRLRAPASATVALGTFAVAIFLTLHPSVSHDWHAAVDAIERSDSGTEIWTIAGLIESADPAMFVDDSANGYLNAPLLRHGATRPVLSIPSTDDDAGRTIIDVHVDTAGGQILLVEAAIGEQRFDGAVYAEEALLRDGYGIADLRVAAGVRMTTFAPS